MKEAIAALTEAQMSKTPVFVKKTEFSQEVVRSATLLQYFFFIIVTHSPWLLHLRVKLKSSKLWNEWNYAVNYINNIKQIKTNCANSCTLVSFHSEMPFKGVMYWLFKEIYIVVWGQLMTFAWVLH